MFQRRLIVLVVLLLGGLTVLAVRLGWLGIIKGEHFSDKAMKLLEGRPRWLSTVRGTIYDCKGRVLAVDEAGFRVCLHYKLTGLYDIRFKRYQCLAYLDKAGNENKSPDDSEEYWQREYGDNLRLADEWLGQLGEDCGVSLEVIYQEIEEINARIYLWRADRARRQWYDNQGLDDPLKANSKAWMILEDLSKRIPDEYERLKRVYSEKTAIAEMTIPQPILKPITQDVALTVEEKFVGKFLLGSLHDRPISINTKKIRRYPYGDVACHLIGQLGPTRNDILVPLGGRPLTRQPTPDELVAYYYPDRYGAWGVERMFEGHLRGWRGWIKRDIDGRIIEEIPPAWGADIKLTIDIELQGLIQKVFEGENSLQQSYHGAAVIIDVPSGEVRAMVSVPTFDLNSYYLAQNYSAIENDKDNSQRKLNRALSKRYQPGSTIKPIILLGALEKGIANSQTQYNCSTANKNWPGKPDHIYNHGITGSRKAIKKSCNFYFIKTGEALGSAKVVDWLKQFGFGQQIMDWPNELHANRAYQSFLETRGYLSPIGRDLPTRRDLRFISTGLNPLNVSILQLANGQATIARGGMFIQPSLILSPETPPHSQRVASPANSKIVEQGMYAVVNEPGGTAFQIFDFPLWPRDEVTIYGKTGSTQYSLFSCYARAVDGRSLALAVVVEVGEDGGKVAAPLTRDILVACSELGYLPATETLEEYDYPPIQSESQE